MGRGSSGKSGNRSSEPTLQQQIDAARSSITGKSEKQISYALDLLDRYISQKQEFIKSQQRFISSYEGKMSAGDTTRDWNARIKKRQEAIEIEQKRIKAAISINDAGEIIDALTSGIRRSLF